LFAEVRQASSTSHSKCLYLSVCMSGISLSSRSTNPTEFPTVISHPLVVVWVCTDVRLVARTVRVDVHARGWRCWHTCTEATVESTVLLSPGTIHCRVTGVLAIPRALHLVYTLCWRQGSLCSIYYSQLTSSTLPAVGPAVLQCPGSELWVCAGRLLVCGTVGQFIHTGRGLGGEGFTEATSRLTVSPGPCGVLPTAGVWAVVGTVGDLVFACWIKSPRQCRPWGGRCSWSWIAKRQNKFSTNTDHHRYTQHHTQNTFREVESRHCFLDFCFSY